MGRIGQLNLALCDRSLEIEQPESLLGDLCRDGKLYVVCEQCQKEHVLCHGAQCTLWDSMSGI